MGTVAIRTTTVLMTESEARACVNRIKAGLDDIRVAALELYDNEGWKALSYKSFRECARAEFGKSEAYLYRLVDAARADRVLSPIGENIAPVPESHVRELAPVKGDDDKMQAVYSRALTASNGKPTAEVVRQEVDRELGHERPRQSPKHVASPEFADTYFEDFNQEVPDHAPPADPELADNGASDDYWEDHIMAAQLDAATDRPGATEDADARADDPPSTSEAVEGVLPTPPSASVPPATFAQASGQVESSDSSTSDEDEKEEAPSESRPAYQPTQTSTISAGVGSKSSGGSHSTRGFTAPRLDAGDLSRALLDLPTAQIVEAITENASGAQKQALREALGVGAPSVAPAARQTIPAVVAAIVEAYTPEERGGVLALLVDQHPAERLAALAHRIHVRLRNHNDAVASSRETAGAR